MHLDFVYSNIVMWLRKNLFNAISVNVITQLQSNRGQIRMSDIAHKPFLLNNLSR